MSKKIEKPAAARGAADEDTSVRLVRETVNAPNLVSLYVNDVQIMMTPWDFKLTLGVVTDGPTPSHPQLKIQNIGEVRISPQLAKRLAVLLTNQVKRYEASIGAIPLTAE